MLRPLARQWRPLYRAMGRFNSSSSKKPLPSEQEARRSAFSKEMSKFLDGLQIKAMDMVARFHSVSGYTSIEQLKRQISDTEQKITELRRVLDESRAAYDTAVTDRANVQREINDLLHRKSEWTNRDVERLTQLYRDDHNFEKNVDQARKASDVDEEALETKRNDLARLIGDRYREEQIWSDKIRQFSTWGTMLMFAANLLLFMIVQLGLEPWKRRRLVGSFEQKVKDALHEAALQEVKKDPEVLVEATEDFVEEPDPQESSEPQAEKSLKDILQALWVIVTQDYILLPSIHLFGISILSFVLGCVIARAI